ncbi:SOS response-associated peptidase [Denitromonas iodatirespirans]|uniref:Abasic site processing protein n=1 Tax=Denitromonas iodatirespirans TaxID=2795389 RepID=A0A944DN46_DENI1|nr:SOS response-associated peptidase [Denitromonas iodatirespirans]MBT0961684.1 SOS response-associated peptidase [Denitromonas iodatirespirans]
MCSNYRPVGKRGIDYFGAAPLDDDILPRDIYPGGAGPLIYRPGDGAPRSSVLGTFGLLPAWAKDRAFSKRTYNARSETVAEKPSFRHAWQKRQLCIVPAEAIYEPCYESGKAVWWRIQRADGHPMALAGLWERKQWGDDAPSWSYTMLTVNADAHPVMRRFHKPGDEKRSVVVLDLDQIDAWLSASSEPDRRALLRLCRADALVAQTGRIG